MNWFVVARRACVAAFVVAAMGGALAADANPGDDPRQQVLVLLRLPPAHFRADGNYSGGYGDPAGRVARHRAALQLAREHGLAMVTDWPLPLLGVDCYVMAVPSGQAAPAVADQLSRDARVSWAQPMHVYRSLGHDDPLFGVQPAARDWQLAELHGIATGRDVRVAIVDSGVDAQHPDLAGRVVLEENFVGGRPLRPEAHGTAVAGIIGARADNGIGIAGVAPDARLMALRACWQEAGDTSICTSLSLALALHAAITRDAQIINLSLGGPPDRLLARLLDVALARGITIVAAADREAADGGFPAAHRGVVAVADRAAGPTRVGLVFAPGRDIPTTVPGARWGMVSGASYAAAHVTGLFALLRESAPQTRSAKGSSALDELVVRVNGHIDACATLMRKAGPCACSCEAAQVPRPIARE